MIYSIIEIEQTVIGTFLDFPERLSGSDRVRPEMFSYRPYAALCACLLAMTAEGLPIDVPMVRDRLDRNHPGHGIDGCAELHELRDMASPSGQIRPHLERLEEEFLTRGLRHAAASIFEGTEMGRSPREVHEQFESEMSRIFGFQTAGFRPLSEGLMEAHDRIEKAYRGEIQPGVPIGIPGLHAVCGGWQPGELIVLGGRPGMGKSAFLVHTLHHAATSGKHAGLMTLEMDEFDFDCRLFGTADPNLVPSALRRGQLTKPGWSRLADATLSLSRLPLSIFDKPGVTLTELKRAVRSLHARQPLDLLVVDYIQLLESEERNARREREVSEISKGLKRLAKELKIPVLAAASLNRDCEKRPDKRPQLSDLRESGNIESDADLVIFMYRDEVYDKDSMDRGICEFLVRKNRHGPVGEVRVKFDGPSMTFGKEEVR